MAQRRNGGRSATLYDVRDLDLMVPLAERGGATSLELAELVGRDPTNIAQRLGWMRHFGMVARDEETSAWDLAPGGLRVVRSSLKAAQTKALEAIPDESMVEVMAHVTSRYQRGDDVVATMLRREFLFGTKRR